MFSSDNPIKTIQDDLLHRSTFARQLASAILSYSNNDNFTIALCGKWGSGKTSIINMAVQEIERKHESLPTSKKLIIINFNPWNYSDRGQLIGQFFQNIIEKLNLSENQKKLKTLGELLEKYSHFFEYTSLIPLVGPYLSGLKDLGVSVGSKISETVAEKSSLSYQKDSITKALSELGQKILIIIDDIDRLNNEQIRLVFQLINTVAGFPNLIYLLSFDKDVVIRALESEQNCRGDEYLEKIVQVQFDIPELNPSLIADILFNRLNAILSNPVLDKSSQSYWESVFKNCISPFLKSVRDVNRICNSFEFKYDLMKDEVNWIDLLAISTIQLFLPSLYVWIRSNQIRLVGSNQNSPGVTDQERKNNENKILAEFENMCPRQSHTALQTIQTLFPRFAWITSYYSPLAENSDLRRNKRIASKQHFSLYFTLSLDEIKVSVSDIAKSINEYDQTQLHYFLLSLLESNFLYYYLTELRDRVSTIPPERIDLFYDELTAIPMETKVKKAQISEIADLGFLIQNICYKLIKELNPSLRAAKISAGIKNATLSSIGLYARLIHEIEDAYGRMGGRQKSADQIITIEELLGLEEELLCIIAKLSETDDLYKTQSFDELLPIWFFLNPETLSEYESKCIQDPSNMPLFVFRNSGSWSSGLGEQGPAFEKELFERKIPIEDIYSALLSLKASDTYRSLPDVLKSITVAFCLWYEIKDSPESEYISNTMIAEKRNEWDNSQLNT